MKPDTNYQQCVDEQKEKGCKFEMPAILLVTPYSIRRATEEEDRLYGFDVVDIYPKKAVRSYPIENLNRRNPSFTIRTRTKYGKESEFQKIWREEAADSYVFCWTNDFWIKEWIYIDLKVLARSFREMHTNGTIKQKCDLRKANNDALFINCNVKDFPKELVIRSSFMIG